MQRMKLGYWLIALAILIACGGVGMAASGFQVSTSDGTAADGTTTGCTGDGEGDGDSAGDGCATDETEVGLGDPDGDTCSIDPIGGGTGADGQNYDIIARDECEDGGQQGYTIVPIDDVNGDPIGADISRNDGVPLQAICYREDSEDVDVVRVWNDRPGNMARIAKIPSDTVFGGNSQTVIHVGGEDYYFPMLFAGANASGMNYAIYSELSKDFEVYDTGSYWTIHGVLSAGFSSDDTGITASTVSIEPENFNDYPWCFPHGGPVFSEVPSPGR